MSEENETLRWPTNLDRDASLERLVHVGEQLAMVAMNLKNLK